MPPDIDQGFVVNGLPPEQQDQMFVPGIADLGKGAVVKALAKVDAPYLGTDAAVTWQDIDHGELLPSRVLSTRIEKS